MIVGIEVVMIVMLLLLLIPGVISLQGRSVRLLMTIDNFFAIIRIHLVAEVCKEVKINLRMNRPYPPLTYY